jgi:hypothetical protein
MAELTYWRNVLAPRRGTYTTIQAAVTDDGGLPVDDQPHRWQPAGPEVLEDLTKLWRQGSTTFYGYL